VSHQLQDFDGCNPECRKPRVHTLRWGGCEHAQPPEPTVSMSCVYEAADGHPVIGSDTYTAQQLADLITPILLADQPDRVLPYGEEHARALALNVAKAIIGRNDTPQDDAMSAAPSPVGRAHEESST
jgi:hypothetical protein